MVLLAKKARKNIAIRQGKNTKDIQIAKEEAKLSFFADDIHNAFYIENPIDSTKNYST